VKEIILGVAVVIATLLGPVLAIQASEYLQRRRDSASRKLEIFRRLMATRGYRLSDTHVQALNLIDIEFHDDAGVREAWKEYLDRLNTPAPEANPAPVYAQRDEKFEALLHTMARSVGAPFGMTDVRRAFYTPQGHGDYQQAMEEIRGALLRIARGEAALPVEITLSPDPRRRAEQVAFQGALGDLVSGRQQIKVRIVDAAGDPPAPTPEQAP
jgi:hypothetical protein